MEFLKTQNVKTDLAKIADSKKALSSQRFFKTYAGGYAAGDKFLGITVPAQRVVAQKYLNLSLAEVGMLLKSNIHEHRLTALEILVIQYEQAGGRDQQRIAQFYLKNLAGVNNWDLVDASAPYILGHYFFANRNLKRGAQAQLLKMAKSKNLWHRRIAMVASHYFIRQKDFKLPLQIAAELLHDQQDLIHKAVGWMLREIGKRSLATEEKFLRQHHKIMPRTMLRYAIERFPEVKRRYYLYGA